MLPLEYAQDEAITWRSKAQKLESQKNGLIAFVTLGGIFLVIQFITWASTPDKYYEVPASTDKPEISFHYRFWSDKRITHYIWGKNDQGEMGWISVNAKGVPDGGSMPKDDD
jgi:hypothetical protein